MPDVSLVAADQALSLSAVHHSTVPDGTPFISLAASTATSDSQRDLQIITGRLMTERTRLLRGYRNQIVLYATCGAVLTALLAFVLARSGLRSLGELVAQTQAIGIRNCRSASTSGMCPESCCVIDGFNGMLDRLETSFTQLTQVSADMAHDLRTPIANMLGEIEVALGQLRDPPYYQKLMGSTFEELQRLSKMINNMLFLARAEHADHAIERKALDVCEEFRRVGEYFEGPADERGMRLVVRYANGEVWADPTLLRRALANLLANAVRYADPNTEIVLMAEQSDAGTRLIIESRGPTIDAQHLARLFDRFYRVDASRYGSVDASGLGLSIVRSIMSLHQGLWQADSSDGITQFALFFPGVPAV